MTRHQQETSVKAVQCTMARCYKLGGLLITHFVSINERLCYLGRALNPPPPNNLPANPLTTPLGRVTTTEPYSSSFSTFVINFARPQTVCHNCRRLL